MCCQCYDYHSRLLVGRGNVGTRAGWGGGGGRRSRCYVRSRERLLGYDRTRAYLQAPSQASLEKHSLGLGTHAWEDS